MTAARHNSHRSSFVSLPSCVLAAGAGALAQPNPARNSSGTDWTG